MATRMERPEPPLIVIVGPTASGKTSLAIKLAMQYEGEIICADSRTIYKGMDIGTAKPSIEERQAVPHWGLDLVEPGERFTAADFQQYATEKVADIRSRGKVPFLVGGTGLYVDGLIFDYRFGDEGDEVRRDHFMKMSLEELYKYCEENNVILPENSSNKRYIVRAIEQKGLNNRRRLEPINNSIIVGIATEKETLRTRIESRSEQLFEDGVVEEAKALGKKYGWDSEAMTGNIYPLVRQYVEGVLSLSEVKRLFVTRDWQLAKRQLTWLRRNSFIQWLDLEGVYNYLSQELESWRKS